MATVDGGILGCAQLRCKCLWLASLTARPLHCVILTRFTLPPPPFERIPPALSARPDYLDIPAIFLTSLTYAFGINAHESGMARCGETVRR
jgi:hypothetical protein